MKNNSLMHLRTTLQYPIYYFPLSLMYINYAERNFVKISRISIKSSYFKEISYLTCLNQKLNIMIEFPQSKPQPAWNLQPRCRMCAVRTHTVSFSNDLLVAGNLITNKHKWFVFCYGCPIIEITREISLLL